MTLDEGIQIELLTVRGLTAAQIAAELDLSLNDIFGVARHCRKEGDIDAYRDACLYRAQNDPHPYEAGEYCYVRSIPLRLIRKRLGLPEKYTFDPERKWMYQQGQIQQARARLEAA